MAYRQLVETVKVRAGTVKVRTGTNAKNDIPQADGDKQ